MQVRKIKGFEVINIMNNCSLQSENRNFKIELFKKCSKKVRSTQLTKNLRAIK